MQKTSHNPSQNSNMELFLDLMLLLDGPGLAGVFEQYTKNNCSANWMWWGKSWEQLLPQPHKILWVQHSKEGEPRCKTLHKCTGIWPHEFKFGFQWTGPKWRNMVCSVFCLLMSGTFVLPKTNVGFTTKAENKANMSFSAARSWILKRTTTTITSFGMNVGVEKKKAKKKRLRKKG